MAELAWLQTFPWLHFSAAALLPGWRWRAPALVPSRAARRLAVPIQLLPERKTWCATSAAVPLPLPRSYGAWTARQLEAAASASVAVLYASAYGNTASLAQAISHGITKAGGECSRCCVTCFRSGAPRPMSTGRSN